MLKNSVIPEKFWWFSGKIFIGFLKAKTISEKVWRYYCAYNLKS